jgi:hypothetical protein
LSKSAKLDIKFTEIEARNKHKEIEQKIRLCLKQDPKWINTDLGFRKMYYLGYLGFEVTVNKKNTFITYKQIRSLEKAGLFIECIGQYEILMISIYEKDVKTFKDKEFDKIE